MVSTLVLINFGRPRLGYTAKTNFIIFQTVDPKRHSILIFNKGSGNSFSITPHNFSRKILAILYSFNWPNLIIWLTLLLDILGNICIVIISCKVYEVINFKIKQFFYITKKSGQKCKYVTNETSF